MVEWRQRRRRNVGRAAAAATVTAVLPVSVRTVRIPVIAFVTAVPVVVVAVVRRAGPVHVLMLLNELLLLDLLAVFSETSEAFLLGQDPGGLHADLQTFVEPASLAAFALETK